MYRFKHRLMDILGEGGDGGGDAGDKGGDGGAPGGAAGDAGLDWAKVKAAMPEDLRGDKALESITSLEGLTKSFIHSQKAMGNKVSIPDKHATDEDWTMFDRKLGVSEKFDDYKVEYDAPKDHPVNEEFIADIKKVAHEAGIRPAQMSKLLNAYMSKEGESLKAMQEGNQSKQTEDIDALKKEWGDSYDDKTARANVAFKELLPDEADRKRLYEDGLGAHPSIVKLLASASKFFKDDVFIGQGEGRLGNMSPDEALKKANDIQGDMNHPYRDTRHPNHMNAQEEVAKLYKIAYPG